MGHGKETPRQKMVGLMYLFLTALMALNVSKDVLDSFVLVSESLEKTVENYKSKNDKIYDEFEKQYAQNKEKVEKWRTLAFDVKEKAKNLHDLLEEHKIELVKLAEGPESPALTTGKVNAGVLASKDNIDYGGQYFIVMGKGEELKQKINEFRDLLLKTVPDTEERLKKAIEVTLDTRDVKLETEEASRTWESATFEHIPLVADLVMLAKLQTDVKNMETDVINYLLTNISASDFKFNALSATVIPNSSYIMRGNEYKAEVFLAAYDSTQNPEILVGNYKFENNKYSMVGDYQTLKVEKGRGIYSVNPRSLGTQKWRGLIKIKSPNGGESLYPFDEEYEVAEPSLVISPTKMNVFYYGIENPVAISVPGIPESNIKATISSGAAIRKTNAGYEVKPTKTGGEVTIDVSAMIEGKQKSMGKMNFRIKTIPEAKAKVLGKASGTITRAELMAAPGVTAELEDFVFDLKFRITKFKVSAQVEGYDRTIESDGNSFNKAQRDLMKNLKTNSKLSIEDIEAVGPDGRTKSLSPIIFRVR